MTVKFATNGKIAETSSKGNQEKWRDSGRWYKIDQYDYCPIFDYGAGLLFNTQMAPMEIEPAALIRSTKARPFQTTFNRQIIHARNLFGPQLRMPKLTESEIREVLDEPLRYYAERDRGILTDRVCQTILLRQKQQSQY